MTGNNFIHNVHSAILLGSLNIKTLYISNKKSLFYNVGKVDWERNNLSNCICYFNHFPLHTY